MTFSLVVWVQPTQLLSKPITTFSTPFQRSITDIQTSRWIACTGSLICNSNLSTRLASPNLLKTFLQLRPERFRAPELLFNPSLIGLEYPSIHQGQMACSSLHSYKHIRSCGVFFCLQLCICPFKSPTWTYEVNYINPSCWLAGPPSSLVCVVYFI